MPLTLVTSTRPGALIARLAEDLAAAPPGPFDEETVIVQSQGMARWVRHELARRHGCAASLALPFPAAFAHRLAASIDGRPLDERFERDALAWRILGLLEDGLAEEPAFRALHALAAKADARTRLGLANRLAARFDDYQLYRPDVLLAWERAEAMPGEDSPDARWQAELWRRLTTGAGDEPRHLARWLTGALARLARGDVPDGALPKRLAVFGVSTLPPLFVDVLHAASRLVPVRAYVLAPDAADNANPLFTAFGHASRELLGQLSALGARPSATPTSDDRVPGAGGERTLLARLQADLRDGIARGPEAGLAAPAPLLPDDDSLTLHLCHSPVREMEVLRDQLLAAFAADATLRPHDVLVIVPDVATYAPFVESVFGVGEPELPRIPFHVADRPVVHESSLADALLRLLRLGGARWTAAEVVALLDLPAVRRAAGIPASAGGRILGWIEETAIRWGRDGAMRRRFDLPDVDANTWRAGLDRLVMGYATGPAGALVADVLPCAGDTAGDPATLGALAWWVDQLFDALDALREPRTLDRWDAALRALATTFLTPEGDGEERELAWLLDAVGALARTGAAAGVRRAVDLAVVRDWLELAVSSDGFGSGFLAGGMTVCALKPMRAVPFRVIAVAGLDDATFPRRDRRARYDLLELAPRAGDRDLRADDRQLFLDTVLAARDRLILSYVASSATDNSERAASVVVAELLDAIDRAFVNPATDASGTMLRARDAIVVRHRLQPFSPAYYSPDATRLFSYSRANARAVGARRAGRTAAPFVVGTVPTPDASDDGRLVVSLRDVITCWTNPSRLFCERVLGLRIPGGEAPLEDCEPMAVDHRLRWVVQDEILQRHLRSDRDRPRDRDQERRLAVARGILPPGALAAHHFDDLDAGVAPLLERVGRPTRYEPIALEVAGSDWLLVGRVDGLADEGRLVARPGACRNRDLVAAWVTHLALGAAHADVATRIVTQKDDEIVLRPVGDALALLERLVAGVRANRAAPIPVFEQASRAYVERAMKQAAATSSREIKSPAQVAREKYHGSEFPGSPPGDEADPYVELCWRGRDPLDDEGEFARWADVLWRPLIAMVNPALAAAESVA